MLVSMVSETPAAVREQIVAMYRQGVPIDKIMEVTGSTGIYSALRNAGVKPSRYSRLRDPGARGAREQHMVQCLNFAAADFGSGVLRISDYRAWRKAVDVDAPGELSVTKLFGSWADAVHAAGLRTANDRGEGDQWDEATVIGWMQSAAGERPVLSRDDYEQWRREQDSLPARAHAIHVRFGWTRMRTNAGLRAPKFGTGFNLDELTAAVSGAGDGSFISRSQYQQWRDQHPDPQPSSVTISKKFGSWDQACAAGGLGPRPVTKPTFSGDEAIAALQEVGGNRYITKPQYDQWRREQPDRRPSCATICDRFGTWRRACTAAGLKRPTELNDQELLANVNAATAEFGNHPTTIQYQQWAMRQHARPGIHLVQHRYSFLTRTLKPKPGQTPS
jgi:hypothetical protein